MGPDVSLYSIRDAEMNRRHYEALDALYERAQTEGREVTDDERRDLNGRFPLSDYADVPSERYPNHLFNRRYLRSSYNGGGFNHAVPEMLGTAGRDGAQYPHEYGSLYWIFEPMGREWDGDEGDLTAEDLPKLAECRKRAEAIVAELSACDRLRVMTVSSNMFSERPRHSDNDALRMYREAVAAERVKADEWWCSLDMDVFGDGVPVLAAVPGDTTFGIPGVHLIYRASDEGFGSYVQSAEIVVEFVDEAMMLIARDGGAQMSWSG